MSAIVRNTATVVNGSADGILNTLTALTSAASAIDVMAALGELPASMCTSRGGTNGTPKSRERYWASSPQTRRPRTKCGTRILVMVVMCSALHETAHVGVDRARAGDLVVVAQLGIACDVGENRLAGPAAG